MTFEAILFSCIIAVEDDQSVESCLARYPEQAAKLEPLLRIVAQIHAASTQETAVSSPHRKDFRAVLLTNLEAVEENASIEACLAAYPSYAARLRPLLQLAAQVHALQEAQTTNSLDEREVQVAILLNAHIEAFAPGTKSLPPVTDPVLAQKLTPLLQVAAQLRALPKSKLSHAAFLEGRKLVAHAAIDLQTVTRPTANPTPAKPAPARPLSAVPARVSAAQPTQPSIWSVRPWIATAASLMLVAVLVLQTAAFSLPGDVLYPVKRGTEEVQRVVVGPFRKPGEWHMSQLARRVEELESMEAAGRPPDPKLVEEVQEEVEQVLVATDHLPPAEREPILAAWFQWLSFQSIDPQHDRVVAEVLAEPIATVESVLEEQIIAIALAPTATWPVAEGVAGADIAANVPQQVAAGNAPVAQSTDTVAPQIAATPTPLRGTPTGGTQTDPSQPTPTVLTEDAPASTNAPTRTVTRTPITPAANRLTPTTTPAVRTTATPIATAESLIRPTVTRSPGQTPSPTPQPVTILLTQEPTSETPRQVTREPANEPTSEPTVQVIVVPTIELILEPTVEIILEPTRVPTVVPTVSLLPTVTPTPDNALLPIPTATPLPTQPSAPEATDTPLPTATRPLEPTNTPAPTQTPEPTATAIALPTNTVQPTATVAPSATPTPTDTALPTPTYTPAPTDTPVPTAISVPTNTPLPTNTSQPTATATPVPTNTPLPTATATQVPTATPEPTDTPVSTDTPVPTDTAQPTATDTPVPTSTATPEPTLSPEPTALLETPNLLDTETPMSTDTPVPTDAPEPTNTATPQEGLQPVSS